mgnify:CR=1 FL=1
MIPHYGIGRIDIKFQEAYVSNVASLLLSNDHNVNLKRKMELDAKVVEEKEINLTSDQRKLYSEAITKVFEQIYSQPQVALS